jgi:hypothetical protein
MNIVNLRLPVKKTLSLQDKWKRIFALLVAHGLYLMSTEAYAAPSNIICEIAIVGGGAAGVHTFFRLAPTYGNKVCLFEKNDYFGGRIKDIDSPNGNGKWGAGALRVMQTQTILFNLAKELDIQLEAVEMVESRIFARGQYRSDTNNFAGPGNPYPTIEPPEYSDFSCVGDNNYPDCFQDAFQHHLFSNSGPGPKKRQTIEAYADDLLGTKEFQFLKDTSRFRGDFLSQVNAHSYLDFLSEDFYTCCTPSYPKGGMSSFIHSMLDIAKSRGGRAFSSEPVRTIDHFGSKYLLKTLKRNVFSEKVVIAVPPVGLNQIGGTIARGIQRQAQFNAIKPIRVITIANWWKEPWWGNLDRGWATPETSFKFNFIEFAHSKYQKAQLATRSVFDDDPRTTQLWAKAYRMGGNDAVNTMVVNQLSEFFPDATISKLQITKTHFQDWPDGWYWLKKDSNFSNADIAIWALRPLKAENISLVGEAYNPNRSTWSDAAYKSSINTLNQNFNLDLKCASVVPDENGFKYVPFNDPSYECPVL